MKTGILVVTVLAFGSLVSAGVGPEDPLAADLRVGYTLADVGKNGAESLSPSDESVENQTEMLIEWETKDVFSDLRGDSPQGMGVFGGLSLGGHFGYRPVMAVAKQKAMNPTAATADTFLVSYQQALTWDVMARYGMHLGDLEASEFSVFGSFGQSRLQDMTLTQGEGKNAVTADVVDNDTGRWAHAFDLGAEFRVFAESLEDTKTADLVRPKFAAAFGYRWDNRFNNVGAPLESLKNPDERYFFRVAWNGLAVTKRKSDDSADGNPLALSLSVEHEWARHDDGLPSGTRLRIEAGTDLLGLVGLKKDEPKTGDSTGNAKQTGNALKAGAVAGAATQPCCAEASKSGGATKPTCGGATKPTCGAATQPAKAAGTQPCCAGG